MIKGVTKSMIEIKPQNDCFEKIILVLSESCDINTREAADMEADMISRDIPHHLKRQKRVNAMRLVLSATAGAFSTAAILLTVYLFV